MEATCILQPVLAMVLLHAVVFICMLATRGSAMSAAGLTLEDGKHTVDMQSLPNPARQVADNYNHLFEAPTVFYAIVFYIWAMGTVDAVHVTCAWIFFGSRAVHSVVQATVNIVKIRFPLFAIGWLMIIVMAVREVF
jgi:hypothetical protein